MSRATKCKHYVLALLVKMPTAHVAYYYSRALSDYFHCDWSYLSHFYKTGLKGEFRSFWRDDTRQITPLAIPEFRPQAWKKRWAGIVV